MEHRWKVLLLISSGSFMAFLDAPVVSVAFPDIGRSFADASPAALAWVLDAYFVGFAALLVVAGRLADRVGRRSLFVGGMVTFVAASLVCAVAPSVELLIAGRVLQAVGAAMVVPSGQGLMLAAFPPEQRKTAIGALAAIIGLGTALAPALGGVVVEWLSWEWIFWVNLAGGAAIVAGAYSLLAPDERQRDAAAPDVLGAVLQAAALGLLVAAILKVPDWGWGDGRIVGGFALTAVALLGFLVSSGRHPAPVVDFALLKGRMMASANVASLIFAIGFYGTIINAVLFLSGVWGYSALEVGLAFIPGAIFSVPFGGIAGRLAERIGPGPVAVVGGLIAGAGLLVIAVSVGEQASFATEWLPGALIYSAGVTVALTGMVGAAVAGAPPQQFALASGANAAIRQVGGAVGVAVMLAITADATPATLFDLTRDAFWVGVVALLAGGLAALPMARRAGDLPQPLPAQPSR